MYGSISDECSATLFMDTFGYCSIDSFIICSGIINKIGKYAINVSFICMLTGFHVFRRH